MSEFKPAQRPAVTNIEEWHQREDLRIALKSFLLTEAGTAMMTVLLEQTPCGYPDRGTPINDVMAHIELGTINGHRRCIRMLKSLSEIPVAKPAPIEATYLPDDPEQTSE